MGSVQRRPLVSIYITSSEDRYYTFLVYSIAYCSRRREGLCKRQVVLKQAIRPVMTMIRDTSLLSGRCNIRKFVKVNRVITVILTSLHTYEPTIQSDGSVLQLLTQHRMHFKRFCMLLMLSFSYPRSCVIDFSLLLHRLFILFFYIIGYC